MFILPVLKREVKNPYCQEKTTLAPSPRHSLHKLVPTCSKGKFIAYKTKYTKTEMITKVGQRSMKQIVTNTNKPDRKRRKLIELQNIFITRMMYLLTNDGP